jgi:hypothetical protein
MKVNLRLILKNLFEKFLKLGNYLQGDALSHYTRFAITTKPDSKDLKYTGVKDSKECATKCDGENKIQCKSFNFCPNNNVCYLSANHLIDSSDSNADDLTCDHYSSLTVF